MDKKNQGLFIVAIVAVVAVVSLFLMVEGGSSQATSDIDDKVVVVDEEGNIVGEAFRNDIGSFKDLIKIDKNKKPVLTTKNPPFKEYLNEGVISSAGEDTEEETEWIECPHSWCAGTIGDDGRCSGGCRGSMVWVEGNSCSEVRQEC